MAYPQEGQPTIDDDAVTGGAPFDIKCPQSKFNHV